MTDLALTLGGHRPGVAYATTPGRPVWTPCLTRMQDDIGYPSVREHCWFLSLGGLYCDQCTSKRPRLFRGPVELVERIRVALAKGDLQLAHELAGMAPARVACTPVTAAYWAEHFSHRAAILEYVGGHPRAKAEAMARAQTEELRLARGPAWQPTLCACLECSKRAAA